MKHLNRVGLIFFILFCCVGCDQATKEVAKVGLAGNKPISLFSDILRLQYSENPGAFLSLGANLPSDMRKLIFVLFIGLVLVAMLIYLISFNKINRTKTIAISLIIGGGIGNLIDRIFNNGRVVDFINIGIGHVRSGIFNIADIGITIGVAWLIALTFIENNKNKKII